MIIPQNKLIQPDFKLIVILLRTKFRISQEELSVRLGFKEQYLSSVCRQKNDNSKLPWKNAQKLIDAARLNLDDDELNRCKVSTTHQEHKDFQRQIMEEMARIDGEMGLP